MLKARLAADSHLVSRFWTELVDPAQVKASDITAVYCRFISQGQTRLAMEFVSGETLEQFFVKMDPAAGEQMVPLFSAILDSFDEAQRGAPDAGVRTVNKLERNDPLLEVIDLGVIRAIAAVPCAQQHGALLIEADRIDATALPKQVRSLALFVEQQFSHDFRSANSPSDVSEVVIASVVSDRQFYGQAPIEPALNARQPKPATKAGLGMRWWLAFGIAAMLAVGALIKVSQQPAAPLSSPADQVAAEVPAKVADPEAPSAAPPAAAPESPEVVRFSNPITTRQRKTLTTKREPSSFKPTIWPPKEEQTPTRPDQVADRGSKISAQAPAQEEIRPPELVQQGVLSQPAVPIIPLEPPAYSQIGQASKRGPGRLQKAMGKVFSFRRKRKEGASSLEPGEQTVTKPVAH